MIRIQIVGGREVEARLDMAGPIIGTELEATGEDVRTLLESSARQHAPMRTGRLRGAIHAFIQKQAGLFVSTEGARGMQVAVGLRIDTREAPYGLYVERGTGIYAGHEPWTVRARGRALDISLDGGNIYRKSATIQGMRGREFIEMAVRDNEALIKRMFEEAGRRMVDHLG